MKSFPMLSVRQLANSAKYGPCFANSCPSRADINQVWPNLGNIGPIWAKHMASQRVKLWPARDSKMLQGAMLGHAFPFAICVRRLVQAKRNSAGIFQALDFATCLAWTRIRANAIGICVGLEAPKRLRGPSLSWFRIVQGRDATSPYTARRAVFDRCYHAASRVVARRIKAKFGQRQAKFCGTSPIYPGHIGWSSNDLCGGFGPTLVRSGLGARPHWGDFDRLGQVLAKFGKASTRV